MCSTFPDMLSNTYQQHHHHYHPNYSASGEPVFQDNLHSTGGYPNSYPQQYPLTTPYLPPLHEYSPSTSPGNPGRNIASYSAVKRKTMKAPHQQVNSFTSGDSVGGAYVELLPCSSDQIPKRERLTDPSELSSSFEDRTHASPVLPCKLLMFTIFVITIAAIIPVVCLK